MKDTFSRQQWVEFTCGVASAELIANMDRHILACKVCRDTSEQFALVERELNDTAGLLRDSLVIEDFSAESAFERWRQNLEQRLDQQSEPELMSQRILRFQLFLTPICGFGTAQRAMLAAARQSLAESVDLLTELEWPAFVKHLSSIAGALCGEPAGRLLWHVGQPAA